MTRKAAAPLVLDEESDEAEGALKTFHTRSFPGGAFLPGSLRAINPRRSDVAILNALLGVRPPERFPRQVLKDLTEQGFTGDSVAKERFEAFVQELWFPPNRGRMGNVGQEVLVSHISLGASFRPKQHYGADRWAAAIMHAGGLTSDKESQAQLQDVLERAQKRKPNLVEKALLDSLGPHPKVEEADELPRLALRELNETLCSLLRGLLRQVRWKDASNDDAERIVLDIVALLRTGMYLNWILLHQQAFDAVTAFRKGEAFSAQTPQLWFGMSKEKRTGFGRSFHRTQTQLDSTLEEGSFAIMALSQLHDAMEWKEAKWFDALAGADGEAAPSAAAKAWFAEYAKALRAQGVQQPYEPSGAPTAVRETLVEMYTAISRNFKMWRPNENTRFSQRSTIGALASMALAEGGALFAPAKGNKKQLPLIDLDLYLLFGRALMSASNRTTARVRIVQELERLGVRLDDATLLSIETELERNGRIRKLSDAGESLYVRVD